MRMKTIEENLAALACRAAEHHDEWDSLHYLMAVYREGDEAVIKTMIAIDPAFHPDLYPLMIEALVKEVAEKDGPPYALLFEFEAFGAKVPDDDAPHVEREKFEADLVNRTIHQRADAVEAVWVVAVDVHGSMWAASKVRGQDEVEEHSYAPGSPDTGGQLPRALLDTLRMHGSEYGGEHA